MRSALVREHARTCWAATASRSRLTPGAASRSNSVEVSGTVGVRRARPVRVLGRRGPGGRRRPPPRLGRAAGFVVADGADPFLTPTCASAGAPSRCSARRSCSAGPGSGAGACARAPGPPTIPEIRGSRRMQGARPGRRASSSSRTSTSATTGRCPGSLAKPASSLGAVPGARPPAARRRPVRPLRPPPLCPGAVVRHLGASARDAGTDGVENTWAALVRGTRGLPDLGLPDHRPTALLTKWPLTCTSPKKPRRPTSATPAAVVSLAAVGYAAYRAREDLTRRRRAPSQRLGPGKKLPCRCSTTPSPPARAGASWAGRSRQRW